MTSSKTVAIACQGGGSHCAFGAGVLAGLLGQVEDGKIFRHGEEFTLLGLSGTSGGAINALMAWSGLVLGAPAQGALALENFWRDNMAVSYWDALANAAVVSGARLQGVLPSIEMAPNAFSRLAQDGLRQLICKQVDFARLETLLAADSPELFIGAANVLSGAFTVFGGAGRHAMVSVDQVLASTAVPELFPPVHIDGHYYWDGLLSQNPPIRNFLRGRQKEKIPDEIWIVRINPVARVGVPEKLNDIRDRRNEMAGNLAIEEERYFIEQVNQWVRQGQLPTKKIVTVHEIALEHTSRADDGLDYASKLDRRPDFINGLMQRGRAAASHFLGHGQ